MRNKFQEQKPGCYGVCGIATVVITMVLLIQLAIMAPAAGAQDFNVIFNMPPGSGGPAGPVSIDRFGNLYGMMGDAWGIQGGTAYRLLQRNSAWIMSPLYRFSGDTDGWDIEFPLTPGPDGRIYGTTIQGGQGSCGEPYEYQGCGTIFVLTPPARACQAVFCPWTKTILYIFNGLQDGGIPSSPVVFDNAGNLYGTTGWGGYFSFDCWDGCGTVYKLSRSASGWQFQALYAFHGFSDGYAPEGGLALDRAGNIYGETSNGIVYKLTPSGSLWTEKILYSFGQYPGDGSDPSEGLSFDRAGNLYGTTAFGGANGKGTVFQLSPAAGQWIETQLYSFNDNAQPAGVTVNTAGEVEGAMNAGGLYGLGYIYRLTPDGDNWTFRSLHDFTGTDDGQRPWRPLALDSSNHLWGAAGAVVWEITP